MSHLTTILKSKAKLAALKLAVTVLPAPRPIVLMGPDSALQLCGTVSHMGVKKVLIVTDAVLHKLGVIDPVTARLKEYGVETAIFTGVTPDPTVSVVEKGLSMLRSERCDAVLALGGGSSIDAAKVMALAAGNSKQPRDLIGILKARKPSLPLFVIPSTAGTGSEVSIGAVISDDQTHQKGIVIDPRVVPVATALDPVIMKGMPRSITADTGIDALTHAVEAWVAEFANADTDFFAGAAVRMIFNHLPVAYADGNNLEAREAMALASHYAGLAMNKAGLGYVHGIAHQLGAHYGIPHGRANSIVLPHVLDFNRDVSAARLAKLARLSGISTSQSDAQAADTFISHVRSLLTDLNIDTRVPNMNAADFPDMIAAAFTEVHGTYAVPKYMQYDDALHILQTLKNAS
ncbi:MAG TPA: iron-containing alcohol dehydrogenase [Fluviicoccus sp.]|nr:iron-containing alcohol dehydrogenase [Fluviicoccus sp.]